MWALWGGVAMMTTASLFAFFCEAADPDQRLHVAWAASADTGEQSDVLEDIELPMSVFVIGIPCVGGDRRVRWPTTSSA